MGGSCYLMRSGLLLRTVFFTWAPRQLSSSIGSEVLKLHCPFLVFKMPSSMLRLMGRWMMEWLRKTYPLVSGCITGVDMVLRCKPELFNQSYGCDFKFLAEPPTGPKSRASSGPFVVNKFNLVSDFLGQLLDACQCGQCSSSLSKPWCNHTYPHAACGMVLCLCAYDLYIVLVELLSMYCLDQFFEVSDNTTNRLMNLSTTSNLKNCCWEERWWAVPEFSVACWGRRFYQSEEGP